MEPPPSAPTPDPRLEKPAVYDREDVIQQILEFYEFLPHIPPSDIQPAPPGGWPTITAQRLRERGIHKTPEAAELLRRLPYLGGPQPAWVAPDAYPCDYRLVAGGTAAAAAARDDQPGWITDAARNEERWPPWVVQLTAGLDREGACWMLDTTDGTVTRYTVGQPFAYPPTYAAEGDPRAWRDRLCEEETRPLRDFLRGVRELYRSMQLLGVPPVGLSGGDLGIVIRRVHDGPGDYGWQESEELRKIYLDHGWPDNFKKEECQRELRDWCRNRRQAFGGQ